MANKLLQGKLNEKREPKKSSNKCLELIKKSRSTMATNLSVFIALTYFIHFNFATGMIRLVYFIFILAFPFVSLITNCVVGNNIKKTVLDEQDGLAINAEFLEYEDDAEDILRKAKLATVTSRIKLQRWWMTPLFVSGWYKMLQTKDFGMQLYSGYIIEMCTFSLPLLILQLINNSMLDKWDWRVISCLVGMALSVASELKGILDISDRMHISVNEKNRMRKIRQI